MTSNSLALHAPSPLGAVPWQRLMMWIFRDWLKQVSVLRRLRQWTVSGMLLAAPADEPLRWFYMVHLGMPTKEECAYVASRVETALVEGAAAGRTLTRATLPEECRCFGPDYFTVKRKRVRVEWVDHHTQVAAWAKVRAKRQPRR